MTLLSKVILATLSLQAYAMDHKKCVLDKVATQIAGFRVSSVLKKKAKSVR